MTHGKSHGTATLGHEGASLIDMVPDVLETDEGARRSAALMHLASIPWPIVAPIVAFVLWRRSAPFVASHALQALLETLALNVLLAVAAVASLAYTLWTLWGHWQTGWVDFSIWPFLARFALGFLALGLLWAITTVVSLRQAAKAWQGVWPRQAALVKRLAGR